SAALRQRDSTETGATLVSAHHREPGRLTEHRACAAAGAADAAAASRMVALRLACRVMGPMPPQLRRRAPEEAAEVSTVPVSAAVPTSAETALRTSEAEASID